MDPWNWRNRMDGEGSLTWAFGLGSAPKRSKTRLARWIAVAYFHDPLIHFGSCSLVLEFVIASRPLGDGQATPGYEYRSHPHPKM